MENRPIYKTAEQLGIEQWEHDGLVALAGPLSRGELAFDMSNAYHDCGTACCIGGWLDFGRPKGADSSIRATAGSERLIGELYFMRTIHSSVSYSEVTHEHAAQAIVNFFVTGDPQWAAVMAEG